MAAKITLKAITLNVLSAVSKVYDGSTSVTLTSRGFSGLVGTANTVSVSGLTLVDAGSGTSARMVNNYSLSNPNPTGLNADITRLAAVKWLGGTSGNWFDSSNWACAAVPDLANVAHVVIPDGVAVSFDNLYLPRRTAL